MKSAASRIIADGRKGMRLKFLGTGASEGVPSLFCNCRVCKNARNVKGKEIRSRACFMIDDDLLIDFPQDVFFDALRYDLDFTAIKYLLITHTHCDHYDYEDLFQRGPYCSVDRTNDILNVYANAAAKKKFDDEWHEDEVIRNLVYNVVEPFKEYSAGGYTVIPLKSIHMESEQSLVYAIKKDGKTYLHAMDTGDFPEDTYEYLKKSGLKFDAMTFDMTFGLGKERHYGHQTFEQTMEIIERFTAIGVSDEKTKIYACHVSHCCGSTHEELSAALKAHGVTMAYDGLTVEI